MAPTSSQGFQEYTTDQPSYNTVPYPSTQMPFMSSQNAEAFPGEAAEPAYDATHSPYTSGQMAPALSENIEELAHQAAETALPTFNTGQRTLTSPPDQPPWNGELVEDELPDMRTFIGADDKYHCTIRDKEGIPCLKVKRTSRDMK